MAVTKIWPVRGKAESPLNYVSNEMKTANPKWDKTSLSSLTDVMHYAADRDKTEKQFFVTGINCSAEIARDQFVTVKKQYGKEDGIVAYHGYQSFAEDEVTPEQAHAIGVEFAQRVWGEDYQVIIATHLNTEHIHNHFVINSISFKHGRRLREKQWYELNKISDEICIKHGVSIVEKPEGKGLPKYFYDAERKGESTRLVVARRAVDEAIAISTNINLGVHKEGDVRKHRYTRQYNFSSMLRCGFCGNILTRRRWHPGTTHERIVWQCSTAAKRGKAYCSCSRAIHEEIIEKAFIKSYQLLYSKDKNLMDEFLENAKTVLSDKSEEENLNKARENLRKLKIKKDNLLNLKLNGLIDDETFADKNFTLSQRISSIEKTLEHLNMKEDQRDKVEKRLMKFKKTLDQSEIIEDFSREVFESVIDYAVIGGYDELGEEQPDMITFIYKTGRKTKMDALKFKRQNGRISACYIDLDKTPFNGYMEIFSFEEFYPHNIFKRKELEGRERAIRYTIDVSVGIVT